MLGFTRHWFSPIVYGQLNVVLPPEENGNTFQLLLKGESFVFTFSWGKWTLLEMESHLFYIQTFQESLEQGIVLTTKELEEKLKDYKELENQALLWFRDIKRASNNFLKEC